MISYLPRPFVNCYARHSWPWSEITDVMDVRWAFPATWSQRFVLFKSCHKKWRFVDQASQEKLQIFSLTFIFVNPSTQHELEYCSVSSSHHRTMRTISKWYFRSLSFLKCCPRLVEKSEDIRIDLQIIRFSWHIRNCWIMWASWKSWLKLFELH